MILVVGLGNPGKKYQLTRHNIGFRVIDQLKNRDVHYFSDFRLVKKSNSLISEGILDNKKIILAKPQTFMNLSGKSVKTLISFYKITRMGLVVIHDDIDLPLGKIRIVKNRGAAGHKGVESIIKELGTKDFIRFRIGIKPKTGKPKNIEKFVLQKPSEAKLSEAGDETKSQRPFNKDEEKIVKEGIQKTVEAIEFSFKNGLGKAMNKFNK